MLRLGESKINPFFYRSKENSLTTSSIYDFQSLFCKHDENCGWRLSLMAKQNYTLILQAYFILYYFQNIRD